MSASRACALLVPVLLLAGCGGGSTKSVSKADYLKSAEAICDRTNKALDALPAPASSADFATSYDQGLALAKKGVDDLTALTVPTADKANLTKIFLDPIKAQLKALQDYKAEVDAAVAKGDAAVSALKGPDQPDADTDAMRAYGFDTCLKAVDNS